MLEACVRHHPQEILAPLADKLVSVSAAFPAKCRKPGLSFAKPLQRFILRLLKAIVAIELRTCRCIGGESHAGGSLWVEQAL
jgi:hypothetical protein